MGPRTHDHEGPFMVSVPCRNFVMICIVVFKLVYKCLNFKPKKELFNDHSEEETELSNQNKANIMPPLQHRLRSAYA